MSVETMRNAAMCCALLLVAAAGHAVDVTFDVHGGIAPPTSGTLIATRAGESREFKLNGPPPLKVILPEGDWTLWFRAPGYFSTYEPMIFDAGLASVRLPLWPGGTLAGTVKPPKGAKLPETLRVTFSQAAGAPKQDVPAYEVMCPVGTSGKFDCALPAGSLDVRIRATGHISHYRFGLKLKQGATTDVGTLELKPGASLVGYVETAPALKLASLAEALVTLEHASQAGTPTAADAKRAAARALTTHPTARGFFHFEGVAPGEYTVRASAGKNVSQGVEIIVVPNAEATMKERLVLDRPRRVVLRITPAEKPGGGGWSVALWRQEQGRFDAAVDGTTDEAGAYTFESVVPGVYSLVVGPSAHDSWMVKQLTITTQPEMLEIRLPSARVEGTVRIGTTPLAAELLIGGETGAVRTTLRADAEGKFAGFLPDPERDEWDVTVKDDAAHVRRTLKKVRLSSGKDEEARTMEIVLPAATLTGRVVDEQGQAVTRAIVTSERVGAGERVQARTSPDGSFQFSGVLPGEYSLQAQAAAGPQGQSHFAESELAPVTVRDEDAAADVTLTVRRGKRFTGRVMSATGPVIGATVVALPVNVNRLINVGTSTDAEGKFAQELPPATREVDVMIGPPGFALRLFRAQLGEAAVDIPVEQRGGTLTIETHGLENEAPRQAWLRHNGAAFTVLPLAMTWGRGNLTQVKEGRYRVVLPMMEPGSYSVCIASEQELAAVRAGLSDCAGGTLAVMGELTVVVPER